MMICKHRLQDGHCYNAEEKTMCLKNPSERYCQVLCDFREWCEDDVDIIYECSFCETGSDGISLYCPNCGAKMDEVEE